MTLPTQAIILRFWTSGDRGRGPAGTGFLVQGANGRTYAVTCGHVANLVFSRDKRDTSPLSSGQTTRVDLFGQQQPVGLTLAAWFPPAHVGADRPDTLADIAIFVPEDGFKPPPLLRLRTEPPARIASPEHPLNFSAFGYMAQAEGMVTRGALLGPDAGGWFLAQGSPDLGRFIEEGLSGAPAIAENSILGMVAARFERESAQGLVIPAINLARAWPPLVRPYPGLAAFTPATAHLFFGHGRPMASGEKPTGRFGQLLERLERQRLVGLFGASGSGKSSLVMAGVVPWFEARGWIVLAFRPGIEPIRNLAEAVATALLAEPPGPQRLAATDAWAERIAKGRLADALHIATDIGREGVLIVLDQFEELFPTGKDAARIAEERAILLPQLIEAATREGFRCLLTGRLDLLEQMVGADVSAAAMLSDPRPPFLLSRMDPPEIREAVTGPAALFGVEVEPSFVSALVADVSREEGRLPLLQEALREAWRTISLTPETGRWMLRAPVATITDSEPRTPAMDPQLLLEGAVAKHADSVAARLKAEGTSEADLQRTLLSLVRLQDKRWVKRLRGRAEAAENWSTLERLAAERLVIIGERSGQAELVHEALITRWPLLANWVTEEADFLAWHDRFEREFATWQERGQHDADLLRRLDLDKALPWMRANAAHRPQPSAEQRAFIAASLAHLDAEERRKDELQRLTREQLAATQRWLRRTVASLAAAVLLAVLAAVGAVQWWHQSIATEAARITAVERGRDLEVQLFETVVEQARARGFAGSTLLDRQEYDAALAILVTAFRHDFRERWLEIAARSGLDRLLVEALPRANLAAQFATTAQSPFQLATLSYDGERFLTYVPGEPRVLVWSTASGQILHEIPHAPWLSGPTASPDGAWVLVADDEGTGVLWEVSSGRERHRLEGPQGLVDIAAFSPDGQRLVTSNQDGSMRLWDVTSGRELHLLGGHQGRVHAVSFSHDGQWMVSTSEDGTTRLWNLRSGREHRRLVGHRGLARSASFSRDGQLLITVGEDGAARLWEVTSARERRLGGNRRGLNIAKFSPDSRWIAAIGEGDAVQLWDVTSGRERRLTGHQGAVHSVDFSPNNQWIVTAGEDGTARLWDPVSGIERHVLSEHEGGALNARFSPDGRWLLTLDNNGTIHLWDGFDFLHLRAFRGGAGSHEVHFGFARDGRRIFTSGADGFARAWHGHARLWELASSTLPWRLTSDALRATSAAFSPTGRVIVTASYSGPPRLWDFATGAPIAALRGRDRPARTAAFSPDGRWIVTTHDERPAQLWNAETGAPVAVVGEPTSRISGAIFSPEGGRILTTSPNRPPQLWSADTGAPGPVLGGPEAAGAYAAVSPDGRLIVTVARDSPPRLWEAATGAARHALGADPVQWAGATFGPLDSRRIITIPERGPAQLWNIETGAPVFALGGPESRFSGAAFSPDGRLIVTTSQDGPPQLWDAQTGAAGPILPGQDGTDEAPFFSPNSRWIFLEVRGAIQIWEAATARQSLRLGANNGLISVFGFSPDGHHALIGQLHGQHLFELQQGAIISVWPLVNFDAIIDRMSDRVTRARSLFRQQECQFFLRTENCDSSEENE